MLVDNFGAVPLRLVPMESPIEPPLPRTSVKEVYDADRSGYERSGRSRAGYYLLMGTMVVSVKPLYRPCWPGLYLTMAGFPLHDEAKYADARDYASKVIQSNVHGLNSSFSQIFINHAQDKYDIKECLWEVEYYGNNRELGKRRQLPRFMDGGVLSKY